MADYLTLPEIIAIHQKMIERFGGSHGIRDLGAAESACFRPQTGYYNDIISEAAALMESLAINHPFIDGNKRVAFAATDIFLRINGYRITATSLDIYQHMITLFETGRFELTELESFLRKNTKAFSS